MAYLVAKELEAGLTGLEQRTRIDWLEGSGDESVGKLEEKNAEQDVREGLLVLLCGGLLASGDGGGHSEGRDKE